MDELSEDQTSSSKLSYFAIALSFISIILSLGILALYLLSNNNNNNTTNGSTGAKGIKGMTGQQWINEYKDDIWKRRDTVMVYGSYVVFNSQGKYDISTTYTYSLEPHMSYATIVSADISASIPFSNKTSPNATYATAFYIENNTMFKLGDRFNIIANVPFYILSPHNSIDPISSQKIYLPKQILYNNNINFNNNVPNGNFISYSGCMYFPAGYLYNFTITDTNTVTVADPDGISRTLPILYYSFTRVNLAGTFSTIWNYNISNNQSRIPSVTMDIPIDYQSIEYIYPQSNNQISTKFETPIVAYNGYRFTISNTPNANLMPPEIIITYQALSLGDYFFYEPYNHDNNPTSTYSSLILSTGDPTITITIINSTVPNGTPISSGGNGLDRYTINLDFNSSYKITLVSWITNTDYTKKPNGTYLVSINKIPYTS